MPASLSSLTPDTQEKYAQFVALCANVGVTVTLVSARRTCAEQNAAYAQGRTTPGATKTNARGCQSWHVWGRAFDIDVSPKPVDWAMVSSFAKSVGLQWGGDWKGASGALKDYGHFENREGLSLEVVCPDPDACVDNANVDLPNALPPGQMAPPAGDWMTSGCTGPRYRALVNGQWEIESEGTPQKDPPAWIRNFLHEIRLAEKEFGVPSNIIVGILSVEGSHGNPKATSGAAWGLMQLTPATAKSLNGGVTVPMDQLTDPLWNIRMGTKLLASLGAKYKGNIIKVAFSYNAGGPYCGTGKVNGAPCPPANRWGLVADCHCSKFTKDADGKMVCTTWFTYDYGTDVLMYANAALFLYPPGAPEEEPPPAPTPNVDPPSPLDPDNPPPAPVASQQKRSGWGTFLMVASAVGVAFAAGSHVLSQARSR